MARKRALRVATEADAPETPKTLEEAVESGTYLEVLVAQRRQMVEDVKTVQGPALAALHRQIALHSKEIEALRKADEQERRETGAAPADEAYDSSAV